MKTSTRAFLRRLFWNSGLRPSVLYLRHRGLQADDVFIASYPRSGSTWLRFMLYEMLAQQPAGFESVNEGIPDVGRHLHAPRLLAGKGRLIKTHETYRRSYGKAIYLVRDPRDVILSEYNYQLRDGLFHRDFECFLASFLSGTANPFGSWVKHVECWLDSGLSASNSLLVIRFEDMRRDTEGVLGQVLGFLKVHIHMEAARAAIGNNRLLRMKEKETRATGSVLKAADQSHPFVNKGAVEGWRGKLEQRHVQVIGDAAQEVLGRLGYPAS